jgi:hypothetical protein
MQHIDNGHDACLCDSHRYCKLPKCMYGTVSNAYDQSLNVQYLHLVARYFSRLYIQLLRSMYHTYSHHGLYGYGKRDLPGADLQCNG